VHANSGAIADIVCADVDVGVAGSIDGLKAVVGTRSTTVTVVLHNACGTCVTAGSSRGLIVDLARASTVAGVLCGAISGVVATGRISGYKAVVGTRSTTVTVVLVDALGAEVSAGSVRGLIVGLARASAVAGVGIGALGVTAVTAGRISVYIAVIGA
jgi:hypothetical protein